MFDNEDEYSKFVEHCQDIGKVAGLLDQLRGWTVYRTPYPTLKRLVHALCVGAPYVHYAPPKLTLFRGRLSAAAEPFRNAG